MQAKLTFCYGTMSSSKTLRLLTTAYNFEENNIPFICLKPSKDTREDKPIIKSRIGLERECIMIDDTDNLFEVVNKHCSIMLATGNPPLEWILIDECQFLEVEQVDELAHIVDELHVNVMCYGLRTDFQSKLFPASKRLFELADTFEEIKSRCSCGGKTSINARFDKDGNLITEGEQILIGDGEYKPLCRKCYMELLKESNTKK